MFRPTSPQLSLMESRFLMSPRKRERLERSWAHAFREHVLPLIDEDVFRPCFSADNGRPNTSIRLLVGLHLLKEADDLTDEQILDALEFNLQWQHALGVEPADAHLCEKTLHNFRNRLMESERGQRLFQELTAALMKADGLSAVRQRLDSTHVISNIAVLTRLGLFTETLSVFLRELRKESPEKLAKLGGEYARRYLDREGYFADATREQAPRRLVVVGQDLYALVRTFASDTVVRTWSSYGLLERLLAEQCKVVGAETAQEPVAVAPGPERSDEAASPSPSAVVPSSEPHDAAPVPPPAAPPVETMVLKEGKEISGSSLQSPHDPDATYGHKGKGYELQLAETCVAENPYQVITAAMLTAANASDQNATVPVVEELVARGIAPETMLADTGYGSGENIIACAELGVTLVAPVRDPGAPAAPDAWAQPAAEVAPPASPPAPNGKIGFSSFTFNADYNAVERCPAGHGPHRSEVGEGRRPNRAIFDGRVCGSCPFADRCPTRPLAKLDGDRVLDFRDAQAATATRQREQQTSSFKDAYRLRSGIESTNAEIKGRHGAGDLRVRGEARVDLSLHLKALALNVKRAVQHHVARFQAGLTAAADLEASLA